MIKLSILYPNKPGSRLLQADIPRYTDVAPLIQFNEVKLSEPAR